MKYQAVATTGTYRGPARNSFAAAETDAAIQRVNSYAIVEVWAICPNCGQWRHSGDCLNGCAKRNLAPAAGPDTLNL